MPSPSVYIPECKRTKAPTHTHIQNFTISHAKTLINSARKSKLHAFAAFPTVGRRRRATHRKYTKRATTHLSHTKCMSVYMYVIIINKEHPHQVPSLWTKISYWGTELWLELLLRSHLVFRIKLKFFFLHVITKHTKLYLLIENYYFYYILCRKNIYFFLQIKNHIQTDFFFSISIGNNNAHADA